MKQVVGAKIITNLSDKDSFELLVNVVIEIVEDELEK